MGGLDCRSFPRDDVNMNTLNEILAAARTLSSGDLARLIPLIWDQVAPEDWTPPSSAWLAEANRRSDSIDAGNMKADDWTDVRDRARRKAGLSE